MKTHRPVLVVCVVALTVAANLAIPTRPADAALPIPPACVPRAPEVAGVDATSVTLDVQPCFTLLFTASSYRVATYAPGSSNPLHVEDHPVPVARVSIDLETAVARSFTVTGRNSTWTSASSSRSNIVVPPFATVDEFVRQQYLGFAASAATPAQVAFLRAAIGNGSTTALGVTSALQDAEYWLPKLAPVSRLYQAYFLRLPDKAGFGYWVGRLRGGTTLATVSSTFASSTEFQNRYGSLTNAQFVDLVYQNVLGRSPDAPGRTYWIGKLNGGFARSEMMRQFSESAEHVNKTRVMVETTSAYFGLVNRMPTAAEVAIQAGRSRPEINQSVMALPEYADRFAEDPVPLWAPEWDARFTRFEQPVGVTQGDGARSTLLPDGRIYWSMGDSNVGTLSKVWPGSDGTYRRLTVHGQFDHAWIFNTAVVTDDAGGYESFYNTDPVTGDPRPLFPTADPNPANSLPAGHDYWPGAAVLEEAGEATVLRTFLMDVGWNDDLHPDTRRLRTLDPATLEQIGTTLLVPSPSYTEPTTGATAPVLFGNAILEDGGYIYVYGEWKQGLSCDSEDLAEKLGCLLSGERAFVARVPSGDLTDFSAWRYYSGGTTWSASGASMQPVADHRVDSVVKTPNGNYLTFFIMPTLGPGVDLPLDVNPDAVTNSQLITYQASAPTGPWNILDFDRAAAYDIPDDESIGAVGRYNGYLPMAHPSIRHPEHPNLMLLGWSSDVPADFVDLPKKILYRPRFVWLDLSEL